MATERKLEEIHHLIDNLSEETSQGIPVVVEGPNDMTTLENLGVEADFVCAKTSGKSHLDVIDEVLRLDRKEVILLLDFDRRGKELTALLSKAFRLTRIKPNLNYWKNLHSLVGRDIKDIEGLTAYINTLARQTGKAGLEHSVLPQNDIPNCGKGLKAS